MTKKITIEYTKEMIHKDVLRSSAYIAFKDTLDGSTYEHIAAQEEDAAFFDQLMNGSLAVLCDLLEHYVSEDNCTDLSISYTLEMPSNWNQLMTNALKKAIRNFLSVSILAGWVRLTKNELEKEYAADESQYICEIKKLIYKRERPSRPTAPNN